MSFESLTTLNDDYDNDIDFAFLRQSGIFLVPGSGPLDAKLMLVGEAPGRLENAKRIPFVGSAGIELNKILVSVGIDPYNIYRTNVIKYWPRDEEGKTRKPTEKEIKDSSVYLKKEIEAVQPDFVGLCGATALQAIFPGKKRLSAFNGTLIEGKFVPLYHPAVVGYRPEMRRTVRFGYQNLKEYLDD